MKNLKKLEKKIPVSIKVEKLAGILTHILLIASVRISIRMILSKKEDSLAHKIQGKKKKNFWKGGDVMGFRNSWKQLLLYGW